MRMHTACAVARGETSQESSGGSRLHRPRTARAAAAHMDDERDVLEGDESGVSFNPKAEYIAATFTAPAAEYGVTWTLVEGQESQA